MQGTSHPESTYKEQVLPVMETFYSIQGEGFYQGSAAFFIRLAGCDVGCVWCDVKESWDAGRHAVRLLGDLVQEVKDAGATRVIITGGEPLMYDCGPLTKLLQAKGIATHLETSGAYPLSGSWDWICISPKKFKEPLTEVLKSANELKVVIYHRSDFAWAEKFRNQVAPACQLYLQPEWTKEREHRSSLFDYIRQHPEWQLSLQIHKYLEIR